MLQNLHRDLTFQIIGILFDVHKNLGKGFSEIVYKDAIEYEFSSRGIPFEREKEYAVRYRDVILRHKFFCDFVVFDKIILEIKSVESLGSTHISQCLNYLRVSGIELALLVNFNKHSLEYKRVIQT